MYFNVRGGQDRNDDPHVASEKVEAYRVKRLVGIQQAGQGQPSTWLGSLFSVHSILGVHQEARCPRVESWKPARETGCQDSNLVWSGLFIYMLFGTHVDFTTRVGGGLRQPWCLVPSEGPVRLIRGAP